MTPSLPPPANPFLPIAPQTYAARQQEQFANALRLYFNQLNGTLGALLGVRGGQYLNFPYGSAYEDQSLTALAANTPYLVVLNRAGPLNGVTVSGTNGLVVPVAGVYNYAFSIQFRNTDSNFHRAVVWLRVNNVVVPWTASYASIPAKHGSLDGTTIMAANFLLELNPLDQVDMWWQTSDTDISLWAVPAAGAVPGSPSVAVSLTYVSSLP